MFFRKVCLLTILFFSLLPTLQASAKGKEFWLGFMGNIDPNTPIQQIALLSDQPVTGTVEVPRLNWSQSFSLPAGGSTLITFPSSLVHPFLPGFYDMGVHVSASDSISVVLLNTTGASDDASWVTPLHSLGYDYMVTTWLEPAPRDDKPEFIIVATEDNTEVEITLPGGSPDTLTLDQGMLYQAQTSTELTGTRIRVICDGNGVRSPVAVFSGTRSSTVGGCNARDHLVEQMHDIHTWGTEYLLPNLSANDTFQVVVLAAENQTQVSLNNGPSTPLNSGQFLTLLQGGAGKIAANKPISVCIFTRGKDCTFPLTADPYMLLVPPLNLGLQQARFYAFNSLTQGFDRYLHVITPTANTGNITLNGTSVPATWAPVPFHPGWSQNQLLLPGSTSVYDLRSSGAPFQGYVSGELFAVSFGYTLGVSNSVIPEFDIAYLQDTVSYLDFSDTICACEPLTFLNSGDLRHQYSWDLGDGTFITGDTIVHDYLNGTYVITLTVLDAMGGKIGIPLKDTLTIVNCDISMNPLSPICVGDSVVLTANVGTQFVWSTGATTGSITVSPTSTTTYGITIDNGNTPVCDSIIVYVNPVPQVSLPDSLFSCSNDPILLAPQAGQVAYLWSTGSTQPAIEVNQPGWVWVEVTNTFGCSHRDSSWAAIQTPTPWSLGPDPQLCEGDPAILYAPNIPGAQFLWSDGTMADSLLTSQDGRYTLTVVEGLCTTEDSIFLHFIPLPYVNLPADTQLCLPPLPLEVSHPEAIFTWSTGASGPSLVVNEPGTYSVTASNFCGQATDSIKVDPCEFFLFIPNVFTPNGDGFNDFFDIEVENQATFELHIFDRWGSLMFYSAQAEEMWNGNSRLTNTPVQAGVYYYIVRILDKKGIEHEEKGFLSIVR